MILNSVTTTKARIETSIPRKRGLAIVGYEKVYCGYLFLIFDIVRDIKVDFIWMQYLLSIEYNTILHYCFLIYDILSLIYIRFFFAHPYMKCTCMDTNEFLWMGQALNNFFENVLQVLCVFSPHL